MKEIYQHYKRDASYYEIPESWLSKMTLEQLTETGKEVPSLKKTLAYNYTLFLKTFDVRDSQARSTGKPSRTTSWSLTPSSK